jgi:hypothetical protein
MIRNVTAISISARAILAAGLLASAATAMARDKAQEVVRDREPDVGDVAATPITDLNLAKDEIPEVLLASVEQPYASSELDSCDAIASSIAELDTVLGPDYDLEDEEGDRFSEGRIAQGIVGSFIPFRGIIREISGAADHKRKFEAAIMGGMVRRGYLKGLGEARGCDYPARPAFTRVAVIDPKDMPAQESQPETASEPSGLAYASVPVVQGED